MNNQKEEKPETLESIRKRLEVSHNKIERNAKRVELAVQSSVGKKWVRIILEK